MTKKERRILAKRIAKKFFILLLKYGEKAAKIWLEGEIKEMEKKYGRK